MSTRGEFSSRHWPPPASGTQRMVCHDTPATSSTVPLGAFNDWLQDLERRESLMDDPPAVVSALPGPPSAPPTANRWLARMKPHDEKVIAGLIGSLSDDHVAVEDVVNHLEGDLRFADGSLVLEEDHGSEDSLLEDRHSGNLEQRSSMMSEARDWAVSDPLTAPLVRTPAMRQQPQAPRSQDVRCKPVLPDCSRCPVLEQQVRMLVQAVAGLGACSFNWSARYCEESPERKQHWRDILKYTQPCAEFDDRIDAMCQGIQAAAGIVYEMLAPHLENARRCIDSLPRSPIPEYELPTPEPPPAEPPPPDRVKPRKSRLDWVRELADEQQAILRGDGGEFVDKVVVEETSRGRKQVAFVEVTVRLEASAAARKLSGVYRKVPGPKVNGRWVYARGRKFLLHLDDGTWAIKEGPGSNADADVYAYTQDKALEPYGVSAPWHVVTDSFDTDAFILDHDGIVLPGRRDAALLDLVAGFGNQESSTAEDDPGKPPDRYRLAVDELSWRM